VGMLLLTSVNAYWLSLMSGVIGALGGGTVVFGMAGHSYIVDRTTDDQVAIKIMCTIGYHLSSLSFDE
jgi:hypothetical protein